MQKSSLSLNLQSKFSFFGKKRPNLKLALKRKQPPIVGKANEKIPLHAIKKTEETFLILSTTDQILITARKAYLFPRRVGHWPVWADFETTFSSLQKWCVVDIPSRPLIAYCRSRLIHGIKNKRVHKLHWFPHSSLINAEVLWENIINYALNPTHPKGQHKFNLFRQLNLTNDAQSANLLAEFLCKAILNQKNIFSWQASNIGITVVFIETILSPYGRFIYLKHVWSTRFLTEDPNKGSIEGIANLVTLEVFSWDGLGKAEQGWKIWKQHLEDPVNNPLSQREIVEIEQYILQKFITKPEYIFTDPVAKKGAIALKQKELRNKLKSLQQQESPFKNSEPQCQKVNKLSEVISEENTPDRNYKNWLIENQETALQNRNDLSALQPKVPFDWKNQLGFTAYSEDHVYLQEHIDSPQDNLTNYKNNRVFPQGEASYGLKNLPNLPENYQEELDNYKNTKDVKYKIDL